MKKLLFAALAVSAIGSTAVAQTRMQLHEEITGENCGPCAATNPGFWTLLNGGTNPSKIIHIAYMSPIPTTGWFYQRAQAMNDTRRSYYGINSAPNGKLDGLTPSVGLHPADFTQAVIDARALVASPLNITVTNAYDATYDSVDISITVTNPSSSATVNTGTLNLRAALVQTWNFSEAPGSNGETHFENVAAAMYPNTTGTSMPTTWAPLETHTYTMRGKIPWFTEKGSSPKIVAWLQNETAVAPYQAKEILNAAMAPTALPNVPLDAAVTTLSGIGSFTCAANGAGTLTVPHTVTIKNTGITTLTSATIYSRFGTTGAWTSTPWSGSLATGATTTVSVTGSGTVSGAGYYTMYDSIDNPNGSMDNSVGNNTWGKQFFIESTTGAALPFSTSFETTAEQNKYYYTDDNSDGWKWGIFQNGTPAIGHTGLYIAAYRNYYHPAGEVEVMTLPVFNNNSSAQLKFWLAHAQKATSNTDKLEVVYSTNCGSSWTSAWSLSGSAMATVPASPSALYIPTPASYQEKTVSLASVPAGAMLGFRATNGGGNMTAIDDINIINTVSVNEVATSALNLTVFPNPAVDNATVSMNLMNATEATINVVDNLGRTVAVVSNGKLTAGTHTFNVDTRALASGIYNVVVIAEGGTFTQRLTVAK